MKKTIALLFAIMAYAALFAQAYDGQADYNKKTQPAVITEYKYPEETVEKTLRDKLERMGLKVKSSKGYLMVTNAIISSVSSSPMDYTFKIEKKSKREKDITIVTMLMHVNEGSATAENSGKGKSFLNEMSPAIDASNNDNMVNDQYAALVKEQKKLKKLQDEQTSLEKKIRNLQDDLKTNEKDQADQQKEIQRQQEVLDVLKTKKTG